jgi:hypothetical protein
LSKYWLTAEIQPFTKRNFRRRRPYYMALIVFLFQTFFSSKLDFDAIAQDMIQELRNPPQAVPVAAQAPAGPAAPTVPPGPPAAAGAASVPPPPAVMAAGAAPQSQPSVTSLFGAPAAPTAYAFPAPGATVGPVQPGPPPYASPPGPAPSADAAPLPYVQNPQNPNWNPLRRVYNLFQLVQGCKVYALS